jgi:uncharacterized protein (DUF1778 family)
MPAATARLNMRVREETLDRIRAAAEITGTDVTAFVIAAATAEARKVMLEERAIRLTPREVDQLAALEHEERELSPALVVAARRLAQNDKS